MEKKIYTKNDIKQIVLRLRHQENNLEQLQQTIIHIENDYIKSRTKEER